MIMKLPREFKLSFAEVIGRELVIYQLIRYGDMMYELTYALKGRKCVYCGKTLDKTTSTLDHRFPQYTGGVSITNNLYPCCRKCNEEKDCMTHSEYKKYRELSSKRQKTEYLKRVKKQKIQIFKTVGYCLPNQWVRQMNLSSIESRSNTENLKGKTYQKISEFYSLYGNLPKPAIVDKNNQLLKGYNLLLFAEEHEIKRIPVIKLENVELRMG